MSGRNTFRDLTKGFSSERRGRVDARKTELRAAMLLHELRQEQRVEIKALADLPDEEIDTTDIPEILDWSGAKRVR